VSDGSRTAAIPPRNHLEVPIGKFLLRERYQEPTPDEMEYRRRNTHPPAELVRAFRPNFDRESQLRKAFRDWVDVLAKNPKNYKVQREVRRRPNRDSGPSAVVQQLVPFAENRAGYMDMRQDERFVAGGCCCKRGPIPPRNQISPPHGNLPSDTVYADQYWDKNYSKRDLIPPRSELKNLFI
jgi:hypothetical protein